VSDSSDPGQTVPTTRVEVRLLTELIGIPAPRRLLEVGCGRGRLSAPLLRLSSEYVGVDRDSGVLRDARANLQRSPGFSFVQADASRLPFRVGSFEVVVGVRIYHRFRSPGAFLGEARRVLAAKGRLVLQFAPRPSLFTLSMDVWRFLRSKGAGLPLTLGSGDRVVDSSGSNPGYLEKESTTRKRVQEAGFRIVMTHRHGLEAVPVLRAVPTGVWVGLSLRTRTGAWLPWTLISAERN
jgi:SAM-dependent methyltransferase